MLRYDEILSFIAQDEGTMYKRNAIIGSKYYEGHHEIENYRLYYYNAYGVPVEDKTRSNIKISHPFFTELVDQCAQYMLSGNAPIVRSDDGDLQGYLNEYFGDEFKAEIEQLITDDQVKGFGYLYAVKRGDNRTHFVCADGLKVVEVEGRYSSDGNDYVIYYYDEVLNEKTRVRYIQVWDVNQTYYFKQINSGELELDVDVLMNPRPHIVYEKNGEFFKKDLGYIPFFRLDNNRKRTSALLPIKDLIDDYDLMASALSNNLVDFDSPIHVVRNYNGDNLDEMIQNLHVKKAIGVDSDGDVDIKTVEIPYSARQTKLDLDEKNIYRFGMGFNSAQLGDGNITNIVIKSRYALLDLKSNKIEIALKKFLHQIIQIALDEINDENETAYDISQVYVRFDREVMTNALDNATIDKTNAETEQIKINTLLNLASKFDSETLMMNICDVLDLDYNLLKDKFPKDEQENLNEAFKTFNQIIPTGE